MSVCTTHKQNPLVPISACFVFEVNISYKIIICLELILLARRVCPRNLRSSQFLPLDWLPQSLYFSRRSAARKISHTLDAPFAAICPQCLLGLSHHLDGLRNQSPFLLLRPTMQLRNLCFSQRLARRKSACILDVAYADRNNLIHLPEVCFLQQSLFLVSV